MFLVRFLMYKYSFWRASIFIKDIFFEVQYLFLNRLIWLLDSSKLKYNCYDKINIDHKFWIIL